MAIKIQRINLEQASTVQKIYEASPEYFQKVDHSEVLPDFALRDIMDTPPLERQSATYQKAFCLILQGDEAIGVIDIHVNHPVDGTAYIGLFLLKEDVQGQGLGRSSYKALEGFLKTEFKANSVRVGVSEENNVEGFWEKMGFSRNGHTYIWQGANHKNNVFEMDKYL